MVKDYSRGKIYKIVCNITNKIYIGSTCEPTLARRLSVHVNDFKRYKNKKKHFVTSFEIIEQGDYYIELLEIYPCTIKEELLIRERFYIKNNECVNKIKNLNYTKEDSKEYQKEYKENNKDKIKEQLKEYYQKNSDKILSQIKEHRKNNIDKFKEKDKKYYDANKDAINARRRELRKLKKENALTATNPL
jgi:hypothetical protein